MPSQRRKNIEKGTLFKVRGTPEQGLTASGRLMRSPIAQKVGFTHPNKFYNITLEHITGPLKGLTIKFSLIEARKAHVHPVCLCEAYDWPHRTGAGKCEQ